MKEINSIIRVNENCSCDISRKTAAVAFCCQKGKMDNKKAIEWLKAISAAQSNSLNKNSLTDRKEALHMAIQALTKAEPKKPVIYSDTNRADCPVCGALSEESKNLSAIGAADVVRRWIGGIA